MELPQLADCLVRLRPVDADSVDLLIRWTLDPVAQGPHKRVPDLTVRELRGLFLFDRDRQYFLIERADDATSLGRFYWRAWRFGSLAEGIDWELNILLAEPAERGRGYGMAAQRLAAEYLATRPDSRSVFAFTMVENRAERRALNKAGFREAGPMPNPRYSVALPTEPCVLFVWPGSGRLAPLRSRRNDK
jgi:RimJ/RimL family protein N-acetyltransferase